MGHKLYLVFNLDYETPNTQFSRYTPKAKISKLRLAGQSSSYKVQDVYYLFLSNKEFSASTFNGIDVDSYFALKSKLFPVGQCFVLEG